MKWLVFFLLCILYFVMSSMDFMRNNIHIYYGKNTVNLIVKMDVDLIGKMFLEKSKKKGFGFGRKEKN